MVCEFVNIRERRMEWRNIFDNIIWDRPEDGKFSHQVDPKDGCLVRECRDTRHHRLLEFVVPIIHSDKPIQVTITIANTIFGALDGCRPIDWELVFKDVVHNLVGGARKSKSTSICPFLFHLYHSRDLLIDEKDTN